MELTCARCGIKKELCQSAKIDGIKQARICKTCLLESMSTDNWEVSYNFWIKQLEESDDNESIKMLKLKMGET